MRSSSGIREKKGEEGIRKKSLAVESYPFHQMEVFETVNRHTSVIGVWMKKKKNELVLSAKENLMDKLSDYDYTSK